MNTSFLSVFCNSDISVPYQFSLSVLLLHSYPMVETQDLNLRSGIALYSRCKMPHHQWPQQYMRPLHQ